MQRRHVQGIFERVHAVEPLLVDAVADVDRTLLRATLAMSPQERLRNAERMLHDLQSWKLVSAQR